MKQVVKLLYAFIILLALSCVVWADYTVQGKFMYEDRLQDHTGFIGQEDKPIRGADVEVIDIGVNPVQVLASTYTDEDGTFSVTVVDNQVRDVAIRCLTSSVNHPELSAYTNLDHLIKCKMNIFIVD